MLQLQTRGLAVVAGVPEGAGAVAVVAAEQVLAVAAAVWRTATAVGRPSTWCGTAPTL